MSRTDLTKVDVRLAVTDAPVGMEPVKIKCREHADYAASLCVYPDHINCYGCNFRQVRRMDALAYLLYGSVTQQTVLQAISVAPRYTVESLDAYRERAAQEARRDPLPRSLALAYRKVLASGYRKGRRRWLIDRGLRVGTIHQACLGHDGTRFTIPYFDRDNNLLTIRYRRDDVYGSEYTDGREIPKYIGMWGRNGLYLYPENLIAADTRDWIVLVEGELDALRLWQEGIPAATLPNGAGNLKYIPRFLQEFPRIRRVIIAGDQDEPGFIAAWEARDALVEAGYSARFLEWDWRWGKDVSELYRGGRNLWDVLDR
jgi:hypothetical protein